MARQVPKRHQHGIVPQHRSQTGKFKAKVAFKQPAGPDMMMRAFKPQQMPTMPVNNNGVIGESS